MKTHIFQTKKCDYEVHYVGPHLDEGPLPAVFYFALSAQDSLSLDPFNQPVLPFIDERIRVFSITLPGHEPPLKKEDAIGFWREHALKGIDLLSPFFDQALSVLEELDPNITRLGAMGLSRGSFIALHIAALCKKLEAITLFAPMIDPKQIEELKDIPPSLQDVYSLSHSLDQLCAKKLQFFIGNADTRVTTQSTISFFQATCMAAQNQGIRYPPIELHVIQSIGYKGHGTGQETFTQGAEWLKRTLLHK